MLGNTAKQQLRTLDVEMTNRMTRKGFEESQQTSLDECRRVLNQMK